jgi:hypothetical protein
LQSVVRIWLATHQWIGESLYAQQLVLVASPAQSAFAVHNLRVKVSGFCVEPQLSPGRFSAQRDLQLDDSVAAVQDPTVPPTSTSVPQQRVPAAHWSLPVFPRQSSGADGDAQEAAHVCSLLILSLQQSCPAAHWEAVDPSANVRHMGASHTPAPVHASGQGGPALCQPPGPQD